MTTEYPFDQRNFHRIFFRSTATLTTPNNRYICEIIDLSLTGCLLKLDQAWTESPDTRATLFIQLSEDVTIKMSLSVVHFVDKEVGFKCEHIDIDSISQLRRLVELNLGNSELLERDIQALIFNHETDLSN